LSWLAFISWPSIMFDTRRVKCYHMNMIFSTRRPLYSCLMLLCDDDHCLRLVNCINVLSVTFLKEREKNHSDNMNDVQSDLCKLYPLGDKFLVSVRVDEERYSLRFLNDSRRLFASQEEHLKITRVLSESEGENFCSQCYWTHQGDWFSTEKESYLVESVSALDSHVKVRLKSAHMKRRNSSSHLRC